MSPLPLLGLGLLMKVLAIWFLLERNVPDEVGKDDAVRRMPDNPNLWSDGSLVLDEVSGASSAGSGMYAHVCLVMHGGIVSGETWI